MLIFNLGYLTKNMNQKQEAFITDTGGQPELAPKIDAPSTQELLARFEATSDNFIDPHPERPRPGTPEWQEWLATSTDAAIAQHNANEVVADNFRPLSGEGNDNLGGFTRSPESVAIHVDTDKELAEAQVKREQHIEAERTAAVVAAELAIKKARSKGYAEPQPQVKQTHYTPHYLGKGWELK